MIQVVKMGGEDSVGSQAEILEHGARLGRYLITMCRSGGF